jgi:valyl-tRNA synthetase|tara:strand:+ start:28 stop:240 length:213 start_codon:yes stop_codon:yes gene_type:complete
MITGNCGEFEGQFRYDCREALEVALEAKGLLRGKEDNAMSLGQCSRSKDIVEPRLKPQWFVNIFIFHDRI